ncbi:GntR family transcriptional regulator [Ochrobactrum sp. MYb15]|uniref:GntR family transcriptional regulator n=1 Tax=Brucella TaxID=234 RepID=UPI000465B7C7|nr:GntR family transcriptional regulator [Brucella rhizosphaerae]PQZ50015.1 GntR family transcriptional regulator [Ochrobactrum sp. MYb19]PRA68057.1 GntR family transcriptional regulator [Ochrobactrum sp. MYb18]PRA74715.1 GntR family transcriptional regulator [Brucella thiophenivorans]PRA90307.1 GntR family transcriptional regulator [Ochrobactrum sp. MYb14]PRA95758.1 GntR family transcriptional regulator [Ochrobactrum sp. MYb15]
MLDNDAYTSPVSLESKGDLAEKALRNAIVNCVLAPGERLSESALATEFALGRGALRSALARLKASGLVSSSARSGWVVTPISAGEIRELSAARRHLEPLLFAAVLDEASIQRLNALGEMHLALTQRNELGGDILPTIRRYEREILELFANRLNMPIVAGWLTDLWDRAVRLVNFFEKTGRVRLIPANRSLLIRAIIEGRKGEALELFGAANTALETYLLDRFLESEAMVSAKPARRNAGKSKTGKQPRPESHLDKPGAL